MLASLTTPIGKIFQPLLDFVGSVLAFFYSIIPNYPIDVALLTIVIMAALTPLTVKSTKNMAAMQALGPEMKKLQQKYKGAENRAQMNEEMMKLYKEHNVNPASGCLPMLLQMPAFFVLYSVIRGITNTVTIPAHTITVDGLKKIVPPPDHGRSPATSPIRQQDAAQTSSLLTASSTRSEWTSRDKLLSHHSSSFVRHPLPAAGGRLGRAAVPADGQAQCPEPASSTGKSSGGHAAEIHAAYLRIYLSKCGGNSERLFHRFERHPHPDAGNPVPEGHRGRPPGRRRRRRQPVEPRRARWSTGPNGRCPSRRRPERPRPEPADGGANGTAAPTGRAARVGTKAAPAKSGSTAEGGRSDPARRVDRSSRPGSTNGSNGKKGAGTGSGATGRTGPAKRPATRSNGSGAADADGGSAAHTQGASALQGQA